jgi:predicted nucleic acid-binding protein
VSRETWVINASPLISLGRIGRLDLLEHPDREIRIPDAVAREVLAAAPPDGARLAIESGFGAPLATVNVAPAVVEWGLGAGETSVVSLAIALAGTAVLDDLEARRAARALGVKTIGTLGVVLLARRTGRIPSAADVVRELRRAGLRLDDALVRTALARFVGEPWEA